MDDIYAGSRRVDSKGLALRVTDHGPADGPAVVLIHGWPDSAWLWRHQVPALVDAGYRVLAHDQRGFGGSDRPADVDAYGIAQAVGDVTAVLDDAGVAHAHIVGHDWGAAVAWAFATFLPDRTSTLTAVSVGHPASFRAAGLEQRRLSWYMLAFQFVGVAEEFLTRDDWREFRDFTAGATDLDHWIDDLSRPGALTASLNWYRANVAPASLLGPAPDLPPVAADVLGIWSSGDVALTEAQMTGSAAHVAGQWRYERLDDVSHWIPVDAADRLNALLVDFLAP